MKQTLQINVLDAVIAYWYVKPNYRKGDGGFPKIQFDKVSALSVKNVFLVCEQPIFAH